jgi:2-iminobutanoate/2-iminopropanoate deaminase
MLVGSNAVQELLLEWCQTCGVPNWGGHLSADNRRYINLPNRPAALPFSDGVLVGDTLYISGRIGLDPTTGEAPSSIDAELDLLFDGFQAVLREADMSMDDLVWVQVYSPDVSLWQAFNAAYIKFFSRDYPARAFLGSGTLLLKGRFEMLGVAVKRQDRGLQIPRFARDDNS